MPKVKELKQLKNKQEVKDLKAEINAAKNVPEIRAALKKLAAVVLGE